MTVGEYLRSLSTAPSGISALTVLTNIEGTYPVLMPVDMFEANVVDEDYSADLDIISISADLFLDNISADLFLDNISGEYL